MRGRALRHDPVKAAPADPAAASVPGVRGAGPRGGGDDMRRTTTAAAALGLALLAGCTSTSTPTDAGQSQGAASSQAAPSPTAAPDAAAVIAKLKAAGLPIGATVVYSAATDVNHLLGRPGGYTSKAAWNDTRIRPADHPGLEPGDVQLGGSIEVYPDTDGAQARAKYIEGLISAAPVLGTEYDYVAGTVVVRVSGLLTPDQAAAYKSAAGA